jgi:RsiW-degrading membrane proteinase PrsW (M82 family)
MWAGVVGGIGVAPAIWLWQRILDQALPSFPVAPIGFTAERALLAALVDEVCKFFLLLVLIRHVVRITDIRDIILTSLGISLAFAVVKDAALLIEACDRGPLNLTPGALLRLISVVPEHGVTAWRWGSWSRMQAASAPFRGKVCRRLSWCPC